MPRIAAFALAMAAACGCAAFAQGPGKPLTIYVGFVAGGGTDTTARIIADQLGKDTGRSIVVENRAGAGGTIAQEALAAAAPDGNTIMLTNVGALTINPHMQKLAHDPLRDLAPITMAVEFPNVMVTAASTGIKSLKQYIEMAKQKPLEYGTSGIGSAAHMAGELLNQRAGLQNVHIPYKGGGQAVVDLVAGRIAVYIAVPSTALPHVKSGKVVALASTGMERTDVMPDVATVAEMGYPGFNATNWYAFVAPGKTPPAALDELNRALVNVLKNPAVKEKLGQQGLTAKPGSRAELGKFMAEQSATWGKIVKDNNITVK
jgi:tripartite-type tricarboxylate transporter receptor subunit TctC